MKLKQKQIRYSIIFLSVLMLLVILPSFFESAANIQNVDSRYEGPFSRVFVRSDGRNLLLSKFLLDVEDLDRFKADLSLLAGIEFEEEADTSDPSDVFGVASSNDEDENSESDDEAEESDSATVLEAIVKIENLEAIDENRERLEDKYPELTSLLPQLKKFHLLGTDELGRDIFFRLLVATKNSIIISFLVALFASLIGILIGSLAGYIGGWLDLFLMRVTDSLLSLPLIPVLIVVAAIDLTKISFFESIIDGQSQGFIKVIVILSLFSWMTIARLVRGSILHVKNLEFVEAARSLGASEFSIVTQHILPHCIAPSLLAGSVIVAEAILIEAGLSFLGLGIQPPTPSLGNMLSNAQEIIYESATLAFAPGFMIFLLVISIQLMSDYWQKSPRTSN